MRLALLCVLSASVVQAAGPVAHAGPVTQAELPEALKPWSGWVLFNQEEQLCPLLHGTESRVCAWPGRLQLSLDNKGGRFTQTFKLYAEQWVSLPGENKRWPQAVKVGGKDAVVAPRSGIPSVRLPVGEHTLTGEFLWDTLPESLAVPSDTGLLARSPETARAPRACAGSPTGRPICFPRGR